MKKNLILFLIDIGLFVWIAYSCSHQDQDNSLFQDMDVLPTQTESPNVSETTPPKTVEARETGDLPKQETELLDHGTKRSAESEPTNEGMVPPANPEPTNEGMVPPANPEPPAKPEAESMNGGLVPPPVPPNVVNPAEPKKFYDPVKYETTDNPTQEDFQWVDNWIRSGFMPIDVDYLQDFEEISGGWKGYLTCQNSPDRYFRSAIGRPDNGGAGIAVRWGDVKNQPDSVFIGTWDGERMITSGPDNIVFNHFYFRNDKEHAIGVMTWADGEKCGIYMVRP